MTMLSPSILFPLLLLGCSTTPTTQISEFGHSTQAITEKMDAVMDEYNNQALTRQFTDYAASYTGSHASLLTTDTLAQITNGLTDTQKKNLAIYRANKALGHYAKALADLANADNRSDINFAAANLYGSITSLNKQYNTLKNEDLFNSDYLTISSTIITAIGTSIVESKRLKAIKVIVLEADPKIALLCDEINRQLKISGIEQALIASRKYVLVEELSDYKSRLKNNLSLEERRYEIKRLYQLHQDIIHSKLLVQQTQKAIVAIKTAHATLADELTQDRFTSAAIASTIGQLKDLKNQYEDFDELLSTCDAITKNDQGILSCDDII